MTNVDYPVLVAGLLRCTQGDRRPAAVHGLLSTLVAAVGADAATYAEYTGTVGRVLAATSGAEWTVGRPVDGAQPAVVRLADGSCVDVDVRADLVTELADQLAARGVLRLAAAGVLVDGRVAGSVHLHFRAAGELSEAQRAAVLLGVRVLDRVRTARPAEDPLATALADGLAVLGADGLVRAWNPAAHALTGVPAGAAIGRPVPFAVPRAGEVGEYELPDGRWIEVVSSRLSGSTDRVVTFRDVSAARRRAQVKDLFVATTSHELRSPVTAVHGHADTLYRRWDQLDDETRRDSVRRIWERSGQLSTLVDRLLAADDTARIDALLSSRTFDLVGALRRAVRGLGTEEAARLRVDLPESLPVVLGDAGSVPTVLTELVQNAHKYSPGGGEITLTAGADERTAYFRVADSGIGIRPEHQELAFAPRWQAEGTDRRRFGGVGLGLYLVRRIVEGQHGWVSLRRRNPDGTVAEVRLPRAGVTSGEA